MKTVLKPHAFAPIQSKAWLATKSMLERSISSNLVAIISSALAYVENTGLILLYVFHE